jgi:hypothetical protein
MCPQDIRRRTPRGPDVQSDLWRNSHLLPNDLQIGWSQHVLIRAEQARRP